MSNKVTIVADDVLCGNPIEREKAVCQYALKTQKEYSHISGLLRKLDAAVKFCLYSIVQFINSRWANKWCNLHIEIY